MPIDTPHGSAWLAHRGAKANSDLADTCQQGQVEMMNEGDSSGQRIAETDIAHRESVATLIAYAMLGLAVVKEVAAFLVVEQGGVLLDGDA